MRGTALSVPDLQTMVPHDRQPHTMTTSATLFAFPIGGCSNFPASSASSSPPSPSLPKSDPAPRALSKPAFKLEKFDLAPLASNWNVLYRCLQVRPPPIFPSTLKSPQVDVAAALGSPCCWRPPADVVALCGPRPHCCLHSSISGAICAAKRGDYIYIMPGACLHRVVALLAPP